MSKVTYSRIRSGFPFVIAEKSNDNATVELWDGSTYSGATPSKSSGSVIHVIGPGTNWPLKVKFEKLAEIYWRFRKYQYDASALDLQVRLGIITDVYDYPTPLDWYAQPNGDPATVTPVDESSLVLPNIQSMQSALMLGSPFNALVSFSFFTGNPLGVGAPTNPIAFRDPVDPSYVWVSAIISLQVSNMIITTSVNAPEPDYTITTGPDVTFAGVTMPSTLKHPDTYNIVSSGGVIALNATEWRSYGGTWNMTTGNPI